MVKISYNNPIPRLFSTDQEEFTMKKWIAFVLIFVLTAGCFAGCNAEKDPLIGTWKGTLDLTEAIMAALDADDTVQITEFKVDMLLTRQLSGNDLVGFSKRLFITTIR